MRNIQTVNGLKVGHIFEYDGNLFRVAWFRSRNTVVGNLVKAFFEPAPNQIKVSILNINDLRFLNYAIKERAKREYNKYVVKNR